MNRFLLGALAMGAVFVLTSFAVGTRSISARATGGPAWTVSQYQLDRAFRVTLSVPTPIVCQAPATGGFIVTQVRVSNTFGGCNGFLFIDINGITEILPPSESFHTLNPPMIVRPDDVITVGSPGTCATVTIAGYTTLPGET